MPPIKGQIMSAKIPDANVNKNDCVCGDTLTSLLSNFVPRLNVDRAAIANIYCK